MYTAGVFHESDRDRAFALIERHPFGLLVTAQDGLLHATHVPFLLDRSHGQHGALLGHLARRNPHAAALRDGCPSVAVFSSSGAYVSPRWYTAEADVPTWNYAAVHVHGVARALDAAAVSDIVDRSVQHFERAYPDPWQLRSLDERTIRGLERGVVAFEMSLAGWQAAFKLSQDKQAADVAGVIAGLSMQQGAGAAEVVALMRERYG